MKSYHCRIVYGFALVCTGFMIQYLSSGLTYVYISPSVFAVSYLVCNRTFSVRPIESNYNCKPVKRRPPSNDTLLTALASHPGSGNTWFRYLMQQVTGMATGSVYCDKRALPLGFPAECIQDRTVIFIKTHRFGKSDLSMFQRVVLIIRDPMKSLQAEFNRRHDGGTGVGLASNITVQTDFKKYWRKSLHEWYEFNRRWLQFPGPLHVVLYENLRTNLADEIQKTCKFLNVTVSPCDVACVVANPEGRVHRKKRLDLSNFTEIDTFTAEAYKTYRSILRIYNNSTIH